MNLLRERINQRLYDLDVSAITAAQSVGLGKNFIYDLVMGRKESFRSPKHMQLVANALDCTVDFLAGWTDHPHQKRGDPVPETQPSTRRSTITPPGLEIAGKCHPGIWRSANSAPDYPPTMPLSPDVRYAHLRQVGYVVRPGIGNSETVAITVDFATYEREFGPAGHGTIVVVDHRNGDLTETSLRRLQLHPTKALTQLDGDASSPETISIEGKNKKSDVAIVAVVTSLVRLFH